MAMSKDQIRAAVEQNLHDAESEDRLFRSLTPNPAKTTAGDRVYDALLALAKSDISSATDQP